MGAVGGGGAMFSGIWLRVAVKGHRLRQHWPEVFIGIHLRVPVCRRTRLPAYVIIIIICVYLFTGIHNYYNYLRVPVYRSGSANQHTSDSRLHLQPGPEYSFCVIVCECVCGRGG